MLRLGDWVQRKGTKIHGTVEGWAIGRIVTRDGREVLQLTRCSRRRALASGAPYVFVWTGGVHDKCWPLADVEAIAPPSFRFSESFVELPSEGERRYSCGCRAMGAGLLPRCPRHDAPAVEG